MRYRQVSGVSLSVIGLGTWQFGSVEWGYGDGYASREAGKIVERAVELGINLFDTAESYGFGRSERILGEAIAGFRDRVVVATKFAPFLPLPGAARSHARASARRLGAEVIDLYQLHFPNPLVPIGYQARELSSLIFGGDIRFAGVSNYSVQAWQEAQTAVDFPLVTNQVHFSLMHRRPLRELIPYAVAHEKLIIAYSPLEQGALGGRYSPGHKPRDFRRLRRSFSDRSLLGTRPVVRKLESLAKGYLATPAQVALAWTVSHEGVVSIPGASSISQLELNAGAAEIQLTADERLDLTAIAEANLGS